MKIFNCAMVLVCISLSFLAISCRNVDEATQLTVVSSAQKSEFDLQQIAQQVIEAFKAKDGKKLAAFVHPVKGVRFSPYAYVDVNQDRLFSPAQIVTFWNDNNTYLWGYADGTGDPINMTSGQYCDRYVLDRDFLQPSAINVNNDQASGNTTNNAAAAYPAGSRVELYIKASRSDESNWSALRLVFEKEGGMRFLVAVIHDEWTI